jgi:hypothetical protein
MRTRAEIDRFCDGLALKAGAPTPGHSAAEGAVGADPGEDDAERRRRRVQHEADPYPDPAEVPEVAHADLGKRYDQTADEACGYPPFVPVVNAEEFRKGPVTAGHAAYSPGYEVPARPHLPPVHLDAGMISGAPLTEGQSRACAPKGR